MMLTLVLFLGFMRLPDVQLVVRFWGTPATVLVLISGAPTAMPNIE